MKIGIVELYCGDSGKKGYYNSQEIGLARAFKELGHECVIFYPRKGVSLIEEDVVEDNILIVYVPAKVIGNHARYDWSILNKYGVEVVQVGSDNQLFAPDLVRFCDRHSLRVYNYIGTIRSDSNNKWKRFLMGFLSLRNIQMLRTHKCFAKTKAVAHQLSRLGVKDVDLAPVGLDLSVIPQINETKEALKEVINLSDKIVLLFVGRMETYKKPDRALEILSKLGEEYVLVMIGTGSLDNAIDEEIRQKALQDRVLRIKRIPNAEIHKYFRLADYFLNFNDKEIFGMSILEAMYQGCSVIAYNAPGPNEIIEDSITGYLVSNQDEMVSIIKNGRKIENSVANGAVLEKFTWRRTAGKMNEWMSSNLS